MNHANRPSRRPLKWNLVQVAIALSCIVATSASAKELLSWSERVDENFSVSKSFTIPGTPGVPKQCAPATNVPYPCPTWSNPGRTCNKKISGPCTPAIPGTPSVTKKASKNLGTMAIRVDGDVYASTDGLSENEVGMTNTVSVDVFGQHVVIPMKCKIAVGTKTSIAINLLAMGAIDIGNSTGVSCKIDGSNVKSVSYPGLTGNLIMDLEVDVANGAPRGAIEIRADSGIDFGSATVAGNTIDLGGKSWSPQLLSAGF